MVGLVLSTGCVAPVSVSSAALAGPRRGSVVSEEQVERPTAGPGSALVKVLPLEDRRGEQRISIVAGRPIDLTEVGAWLDRELHALGSTRFRVAVGEGEEARARLVLRPRLLKAYLAGVNDSKTAAMVLEVEVTAPGGAAERRLYRGQHASINIASLEAEMVEAIQDVGADCIRQLRGDLEARLGAPGAAGQP
jgi:hypothetical protein